jgi:hypothetical protein
MAFAHIHTWRRTLRKIKSKPRRHLGCERRASEGEEGDKPYDHGQFPCTLRRVCAGAGNRAAVSAFGLQDWFANFFCAFPRTIEPR